MCGSSLEEQESSVCLTSPPKPSVYMWGLIKICVLISSDWMWFVLVLCASDARSAIRHKSPEVAPDKSGYSDTFCTQKKTQRTKRREKSKSVCESEFGGFDSVSLVAFAIWQSSRYHCSTLYKIPRYFGINARRAASKPWFWQQACFKGMVCPVKCFSARWAWASQGLIVKYCLEEWKNLG